MEHERNSGQLNTNDRIQWLRDLVHAEEQMEERGVVDLSVGVGSEQYLASESLQFLNEMKNRLIESSVAFNELKKSALGRIKVYGVAKTQADFMLFRNGYKMIFSLKQPGQISIRFNFFGPGSHIPSAPSVSATGAAVLPGSAASSMMEEHLLVAQVGAFGDFQWTYNAQPVHIENIVKFHLTMFIRESAK